MSLHLFSKVAALSIKVMAGTVDNASELNENCLHFPCNRTSNYDTTIPATCRGIDSGVSTNLSNESKNNGCRRQN
jgi:hypothetical protein